MDIFDPFQATSIWLAFQTHKTAKEIFSGLVASSPGNEGKWFAAAKYFKMKEPLFAVEAGITALHLLVASYDYEISGLDVHNAYSFTMAAAEKGECRRDVLERIQSMVAGD